MPVVKKFITKGPFENVNLKTVIKEHAVLLVNEANGAICGIHSTEAEALRALPVVQYNLERGKIPASILKKTPPYIHRKKPYFKNNNKTSKFNKSV